MDKTDVVYRADCPSRIVLDQIADKWSMMVLEVQVGRVDNNSSDLSEL